MAGTQCPAGGGIGEARPQLDGAEPVEAEKAGPEPEPQRHRQLAPALGLGGPAIELVGIEAVFRQAAPALAGAFPAPVPRQPDGGDGGEDDDDHGEDEPKGRPDVGEDPAELVEEGPDGVDDGVSRPPEEAGQGPEGTAGVEPALGEDAPGLLPGPIGVDAADRHEASGASGGPKPVAGGGWSSPPAGSPMLRAMTSRSNPSLRTRRS